MSKVVVIGTGTMGVGIAAGFMASGTETIILGRDQAKADSAFKAIEACADTIDPKWRELGGTLTGGTIANWNDWANTDFVIETVSERMDLKKELFADLDKRVPAYIANFKATSNFIANFKLYVVIAEVGVISSIATLMLENDEITKGATETKMYHFSICDTKYWGANWSRIINPHMGAIALLRGCCWGCGIGVGRDLRGFLARDWNISNPS